MSKNYVYAFMFHCVKDASGTKFIVTIFPYYSINWHVLAEFSKNYWESEIQLIQVFKIGMNTLHFLMQNFFIHQNVILLYF